MFLLDLLAKFGPYAFVLMSVWFSLAFVVAAWRVRRLRSRKCVRSLLGYALSFWWWPVLLLLINFPRLLLTSDGFLQLLGYSSILLYMMLPIRYAAHTWRRTLPVWRQAGYQHLIDVLFFRAPYTTESVEAAPPSEDDRRVNRLTNLLVLDVAALLLMVVVLGNNLQPCQWLDLFTGYSGCIRTLPLENGSVGELALSGDGAVIAANDWHSPLNLYRTADGTLMKRLPEGGSSCTNGVSFTPDGQRIATLANNDVVMIREVNGSALVHSWQVSGADGLLFSPDGKRLAVSTAKSGIQLWRTSDWTLEETLTASSKPMSFSADGNLLAAQGMAHTIMIWDLTTGTLHRTLPVDGYPDIALSPDGKYVAISSYDAPMTIWNVGDGNLSQTIPAVATTNVAYAPDGKFLLLGVDYQIGWTYNHAATLWRLADNQPVLSLPEQMNIDCVAFSPAGNKFAYGTWKTLRLFQVPDRLR